MGYIFNKKETYDTPEGDYRAVVRDAFVKGDGVLRIVFQVLSLTHPVLSYLAGKNYPAGDRGLANDLVRWLGEAAVEKLVATDGTIDVAKLKKLTGDIRIEHIYNDDHNRPFAHVSRIEEAGKLTPHFESDTQ